MSVKFTTQAGSRGRRGGRVASGSGMGAGSGPERRPRQERALLCCNVPRAPACLPACHVQEPADECVRIMNGRFFGGLQIEAAKWDGWTNYNVKVGPRAQGRGRQGLQGAGR